MVEMEITTYNFAEKKYKEWKFPHNYHYLYILENGKDVYIGETNDIIRRSKEHHRKKDKCYKYKFNKIHVITGHDIEETPAKHYERLLLKLIDADQKYCVTNDDKEGTRTHYARKNEFELGFDRLWPKLVEIGIVNNKEFQTVINTNRYKFSTYACLTEGQVCTLNSIVNSISSCETLPDREGDLPRPIFIEGDAGTGKTVVATSLFYYLKTDLAFKSMTVGLVYANPATRTEIQEVFKDIPRIKTEDIISPIEATKKRYDILICDEAHALRRRKNLGMYTKHFDVGNSRLRFDDEHDELDWLLENSERLILFYDRKQIVSPSNIGVEAFMGRLQNEKRGIRPVVLNSQMRIKAGDKYVPYIYDILYQKGVQTQSFSNYEFKLFSSLKDMVELLKVKEEKMGLCRLCGGYAWKWVAKDMPEVPDIMIEDVKIWWNRQTKGWIRNPEAKNEMGSIYSLPGLDLNYSAVVIGPEVYYDTAEEKIKIDKTRFYDNKVKRGATDEELKQYILNTYAVFMTRGIHGTYVYVCDDALRSYLQKFISSF